MREIKFRAWLKDEKKMITNISSIKLDINCIYYDNNQMFSYERVSFDDIELMQYTGLKDKNGVKIFEGDIVECDEKIAVVKYGYHNCGCCYDVYGFTLIDNYCITSAFSFSYCEVIGNIYENPELLEVSNEKEN